jgi:hypothetical protein
LALAGATVIQWFARRPVPIFLPPFLALAYSSTLKMVAAGFPETFYLCAKLHGVTFSETVIAIRATDLAVHCGRPWPLSNKEEVKK